MWSRHLLLFVEPEDLLLCSEEPAIGLCPELDDSSPHSETLFKIYFNNIF